MQATQAIGLFDSGVGGLTVMQQLMQVLPHEHLIYFGDTARVPYGNKSRETIIRYSIENAISLMEKDIKLLVVACHTASAFALSKLQKLFNIPIIGVIEPGAKRAVAVSQRQRIAILGTRGTIQSGVYQTLIQKLSPQAAIFPIICPLFVPLVEENLFNHPATYLMIKEYLAPIQEQQIDTILLGCTHYPLLKPLIQEVVGKDIKIVDSALSCAEEIRHLLEKQQLQNSLEISSHRYFTSDDPLKFRELAEKLFGQPLDHVEHLVPDRIHLH